MSETLGDAFLPSISNQSPTYFVLKIGFTCCVGIPDRKSVSNFQVFFVLQDVPEITFPRNHSLEFIPSNHIRTIYLPYLESRWPIDCRI